MSSKFYHRQAIVPYVFELTNAGKMGRGQFEGRGRFEGKWERQAQGWHSKKNAELRERVFQIQRRVKTLLMNRIYILAQGQFQVPLDYMLLLYFCFSFPIFSVRRGIFLKLFYDQDCLFKFSTHRHVPYKFSHRHIPYKFANDFIVLLS